MSEIDISNKLIDVLKATIEKKYLVPNEKGFLFSLISLKTFGADSAERIQRMINNIQLVTGLRLKIVGGGFGCTKITIKVEVEVETDSPEDTQALVNTLLKSKSLEVLATQNGFSRLVIDSPYEGKNLVNGNIDGWRDKKSNTSSIGSDVRLGEQNLSTGSHLVKILFLAAEPSDRARLKIERERNQIEQELKLSDNRNNFLFESRFAVRPQDLSRAILKKPRPNILHFSGHARKEGAIYLENESGEAQAISKKALSILLKPLEGNVSCVVLNACYSKNQVSSILSHVPYVVAMSDRITDDASISYSVGFYQAIFSGETIATAHDFGCAQVFMTSESEHSVPLLLDSEAATTKTI